MDSRSKSQRKISGLPILGVSVLNKPVTGEEAQQVIKDFYGKLFNQAPLRSHNVPSSYESIPWDKEKYHSALINISRKKAMTIIDGDAGFLSDFRIVSKCTLLITHNRTIIARTIFETNSTRRLLTADSLSV